MTRVIAVFAATLLIAGCQTLGPGTVPRDRTNYADAIAETGTAPQIPVVTIPAN